MRTCKSILTPTTKEPKICHALATTSAFHLKLCHTDSERPTKGGFPNPPHLSYNLDTPFSIHSLRHTSPHFFSLQKIVSSNFLRITFPKSSPKSMLFDFEPKKGWTIFESLNRWLSPPRIHQFKDGASYVK